MSANTIERLRELARTDPTVAPLARLQAEALRAAAGGGWDDAVPAFARDRLADGLPLLHDQVIAVDAGAARSLLVALAGVAERESEADGAGGMRRALTGGALDPLTLLEAAIAQDTERLAALTAETDVDAALLTTLGGLAALPLLRACGGKAAPLVERAVWPEGYCPVCAAWAVLAELRGLEKRRWLRCGRCGSAWEVAGDGCVFCGERDWRSLGYLAPEGNTESRRAATCRSCNGYLKTLASLVPLAPAEVAVSDMLSLELDMAALERGFTRPDLPGFPLTVHLQPARRKPFWSRR